MNQARTEKTSRATKYMDDRTKGILDKARSSSVEDFLKQKQEEFRRKGRMSTGSSAGAWRAGELD